MNKADARREARARLALVAPAERDAASGVIAERIWSLPEMAAARVLLLFAGRADEPDTAPIAREAALLGMTIAYPLMHPEAGVMTLHRMTDPAELRSGRHGIMEPPAEAPRVGAGEVDLVLVPGLAWDRMGGRLGRGAGYFDRLFADAEWRGFRCGIFFACQEMPAVPRDPWDAALHAVVTEREAVRW